MTTPSLSDLRRIFYGASSSQSVSDAEYEQLTNMFNRGASIDTLAIWRPDTRLSLPSDWTTQVFEAHTAVLTNLSLTLERGQVIARGGAGTGSRSNSHHAHKIPFSPGGHSRIKSRLSGPITSGPTIPQWGHMHGVGRQADGLIYGVVVWTDVVINNVLALNYGIWRSEVGSTFAASGGAHVDQVAFTDGSRTTNVVTLTGLPVGHGYRVRDMITVAAADTTYNGVFEVIGITATTVSYWQVAANDVSSGAGTVRPSDQTPGVFLGARAYGVESSSRTNRAVTAAIGEAHALSAGDPIQVDLTDNTYDGNFIVRSSVLGGVEWYQDAVDDVDGGTGTITKRMPFWLESEWRPGGILRARAWPDNGIGAQALDTASGAGGVWNGPPPWDSKGSFTARISGLALPEPNPAFGSYCALASAHLTGGANPTEVRYDNVETVAL